MSENWLYQKMAHFVFHFVKHSLCLFSLQSWFVLLFFCFVWHNFQRVWAQLNNCRLVWDISVCFVKILISRIVLFKNTCPIEASLVNKNHILSLKKMLIFHLVSFEYRSLYNYMVHTLLISFCNHSFAFNATYPRCPKVQRCVCEKSL